MKKINIIYWIFTILAAGGMLFSAVPDILVVPDAVKFMGILGYPVYIISFLGVAKALGVIAILIPRFPRIKEWAYAGLTFDLVGAFYSEARVGGIVAAMPILIFLVLVIGSYFFYHRKLKLASVSTVKP